MKKLMSAQEAVEAITGKKEDKWSCKWGKKEKKVVQQQPVYVQQPVVEYSAVLTESSINTEAPEIYEEKDKEMGYTFVPAPAQTSINVNNTMV